MQDNSMLPLSMKSQTVGENVVSRDMVLKRRDGGQLQRVYEIHWSYDALQYPLIFCRGVDNYIVYI